MGDRSGVLGGTYALGSEACSTTSQFEDDDGHDSGGGLLPIPEGNKEGPPSPNVTMLEGAAAEVAQKAAEVPRLSPVKSGRKSGGQSWLTHSDQYALELSQVTDSYSTLRPKA